MKALKDMNTPLNQKLIFIHVPKTAGATFKELIKNNYGISNSYFFGRDSINKFFFKRAVKKYPIIAGHQQFPFYSDVNAQKLFLSTVRDPIKRIISSYNFILSGGSAEKRKQMRSDSKDRKSHRLHYERWVSVGFDPNSIKNTVRSCKGFRNRSQNFQCKYMAGVERFDDVLDVFEKNDFIVGSQEKFSQFINFFQKNFGWDVSDIPEKHVVKNNYQDKYYDDAGLIEELEELNREDRKLHSFILEKGVFINTSYNYPIV